jgi:hypothetical protein
MVKEGAFDTMGDYPSESRQPDVKKPVKVEDPP